MSETAYKPAKIWEWNTKNGGRFANINRPVSYTHLTLPTIYSV